MRFVYERALDARELTAANFLGLAAIDLDEGNVPGAVALLKRLTLQKALQLATVAAGLSVQRQGGRPSVPQLKTVLERLPDD